MAARAMDGEEVKPSEGLCLCPEGRAVKGGKGRKAAGLARRSARSAASGLKRLVGVSGPMRLGQCVWPNAFGLMRLA